MTFGGGTFDISILNVRAACSKFSRPMATLTLGGDDIDAAVVNWLLGDLPRAFV